MLKPNRLTAVVIANAILAVAPLIWPLITLNTSTLPLLWIAFSLPMSGFMLLVFWIGLGNERVALRIIVLFGGCAYLAIWPTIAEFYAPGSIREGFLGNFVPMFVVSVVLSGMFAASRRWLQLRKVENDKSLEMPRRMQFSIFHLLVLMAIVAVILSLSRAARDGASEVNDITSWHWWAAGGLFVATFFTNTACAAYAALGVQAVMRKCLLVFFVAVLLGVALAFSLGQDRDSAWLFAGGVLTMVIPTVIVLASLLWLRPCGYRLLRKQAR
jgi:hypothetical protein